MRDQDKSSLIWLKSNQFLGLVCACLFCVFLNYLLFFTPWVHRVLRDGFTLGFFPLVGVSLMLLFSVLMTLGERGREVAGDFHLMRPKVLLACLSLVLGCWGYFWLVIHAGFLLTTPVFLAVAMIALGVSSKPLAIGAAVVMSGCVYLAFYLLGVNIPSGFLPF